MATSKFRQFPNVFQNKRSITSKEVEIQSVDVMDTPSPKHTHQIQSLEVQRIANTSPFIQQPHSILQQEPSIPQQQQQQQERSIPQQQERSIPQQQQITTIPTSTSKDYDYEENRYATFRGWTSAFIDTTKLARYGFYYIGPHDTVKCQFCKVEIGRWDVGDNVLIEHLRWSQGCPLLRRKATKNIPIDANELESSLPPPRSVDDCGSYASVFRPNSYPESEPPQCFRDNHPDYSMESDRLKSFEDWPKSIKQKPKELADAGFFYIGKGDQVKCFSCGGGLKDWEENDIPWEQHALFYEKCPYLNLLQDKTYIKKVKDSFDNKNKEDVVGVDDKVEEELTNITTKSNDVKANDSKLCKICYGDEANTIFMPCMHVVACAKCSVSLQYCPICRDSIKDVKRIYFS